MELTQQIIIIIEASFGSGLRWDAGMIPPCLAFRICLNLCFRAAGPPKRAGNVSSVPFQFRPCCSSPRPPLRLICFFGCVSWGNSHPNGDKWKSCPQPCKEGNSNLSSFSLFPRQYLPQHETDKLNIGFTAHRLPG